MYMVNGWPVFKDLEPASYQEYLTFNSWYFLWNIIMSRSFYYVVLELYYTIAILVSVRDTLDFLNPLLVFTITLKSYVLNKLFP